MNSESQISIRVTANAAQAIHEMHKTRAAVQGVQRAATAPAKAAVAKSFFRRPLGGKIIEAGSALSGLGPMGGFLRFGPQGIAIAGAIAAVFQIGKGFAEVVEDFPAFGEAIRTITGGLQRMGRVVGKNVLPVFSWFVTKLGLAKKRDPYGAITAEEQADFQMRLAATREASGYNAAKAQQAKERAEAMKKLAEKQEAHLRELTNVARRLEHDIGMSDLLDPW